MRVIDLVGYLKTNVPYTYYALAFPSTASDDCATVKVTGGGEPNRSVSSPSIQILVRSKNPSTAETKAWEVFNHLNLKSNFNIGSTQVIYCNAQQSSPLFIGTDDNGRYLFSVNFQTITEVL